MLLGYYLIFYYFFYSERIKAEHEKESKEQMDILNKPFQTEELTKSGNSFDFSTMTLAGRLNAKRNNLQKDLDSF